MLVTRQLPEHRHPMVTLVFQQHLQLRLPPPTTWQHHQPHQLGRCCPKRSAPSYPHPGCLNIILVGGQACGSNKPLQCLAVGGWQ